MKSIETPKENLKLKPCPLCGGTNIVVERWSSGGQMYMVKCNNPDCSVPPNGYPTGRNLDSIKKEWNRRAVIDNVICYYKENEVRCKKCNDGEHDYIAIFSYGNLSRTQIVKEITENDLLCIFFEQSIREYEYKKKHPELTLPIAKARGFLFLPLLHWLIPYGITMSHIVSTSWIILFPYALRCSLIYVYADCICSPFFKIFMLALVSLLCTV